MNDALRIIEYSQARHAEAVTALFEAIYPDDPDLPGRMAYDEHLPRHVTTRLGLLEGRLAGQANVFRLRDDPATANLGYHVHPDVRRRGVAKALCLRAIEKARQQGIESLVVRTQASNAPARALARSLGFEPVPPRTGDAAVLWLARALPQ